MQVRLTKVLRTMPAEADPNRATVQSRGSLTGLHSKLAFDRFLFFSDAVFAIAITFLALDLRLPAGTLEHGAGDAALWRALAGLWPKYLSFLVSFLVIGLYWLGHHRMFRLINRFDDRLVWLNLLFLLCIVVIPFPTTVLGEHASAPAAVVLYAGVLALTGLLQTAIWLYATTRRRLVDSGLDEGVFGKLVHHVVTRTLIPPFIFLLSIFVALRSPAWAMYSWILIAPALALADRVWRGSKEAS